MKHVLCLLSLVLLAQVAQAQTQQPNKQPANPPQPQGQLGWVQVPIDTNLYVAVCFISKDTCYAVNAASYYRSEDGGSTWHRIAWPIILSSGMSFVNPRLGYIAGGSNHTAYHTSDGGQTWDSADDQAGLVSAVLAVTKDTALVTGDGFLSRTTDAGKTWVAVNPRVVALALAFADSKHGVAVGEVETGPLPGQNGAGCATTNDGGATWVQMYTGAVGNLYGVAMIGTDTIIGAGVIDTITRTTDGGKTWRSVALPKTGQGVEAIAAKGGRVIAVATGGSIVTSTDGGQTWGWEESGVSSDLQSITMASDMIALAAGARGVILKTTNGGTDWIQIAPQSSQELQTHSFPEPSPGLVRIGYDLPQLQDVTLTVVDVTGRIVSTPLKKALQPAGRHTVPFDGSRFPAGIYTYQIQTERYHVSGKFTIVR